MSVVEIPTRAELDRMCEILKQPSGAYSFLVELTKDHRTQLRALLPKRHFVTPPHANKQLRKDGLRCIIVPDDEAAAIAKMIINDPDWGDPTPLTVQGEHEWRRQFRRWPWG